jgi:hypothetical protein
VFRVPVFRCSGVPGFARFPLFLSGNIFNIPL